MMEYNYKSPIKIFNKHDCYFRIKFDIAYKHKCHQCTYCYRQKFMQIAGVKDIDNLPKDEWTYADPEVLHKTLDTAYNSKRKSELLDMIRAGTPIRLGSMIDPLIYYDQKVIDGTLRTLEILNEFEHPFLLFTKSHRVMDKPILNELKTAGDRGLVHLCLAFFYDSKRLIMEPNAPTVDQRLGALYGLIENKIPVVLRIAPVTIGINLDDAFLLSIAYSMAGGKKILYEELRATPDYKRFITDKFGHEAASIMSDWKHGYFALPQDTAEDSLYNPLISYADKLGLIPHICGNIEAHRKLCHWGNCCGFDNPKNTF